MSNVQERFDGLLAQVKRDGEIHCPHCDAIYEDEGACVSYWGDDGPTGVTCGECEQEFEVRETVRRTYTTDKINDHQEKQCLCVVDPCHAEYCTNPRIQGFAFCGKCLAETRG